MEMDYDEILDKWHGKVIDKADKLIEQLNTLEPGSKEYYQYKAYSDALYMAISMLSNEERKYRLRHKSDTAESREDNKVAHKEDGKTDKEYREVEFLSGATLDDVVSELLSFKKKGQLVYGVFNGHRLYSDKVTFDSAYKEVTGSTRTEFYKKETAMHEELEAQEKEHTSRIPDLVEVWKKRGREVLSEDKWEYWDKVVPIRLNDLYRGMELGYCLDIVKILNNNGTFKEAREKIESQDHSGMSFNLLCTMLKEFCDRGEEFIRHIL